MNMPRRLLCGLLVLSGGCTESTLHQDCPTADSEGIVREAFTAPPQLTNPTQAIRAVERETRLSGVGGTGVPRVWFTIDARGIVRRVTIYKSSGDPALDSVALRSALKFDFQPAYKDSDPVCSSIALPVRIGASQT